MEGVSGVPQNLFLQNVIAVVWDFDKTLIPGYMQDPLFAHYGIDATAFWREVDEVRSQMQKRGEKEGVRTSDDIVLLNHILKYVREGKFEGLNNGMLRELGKKIQFYPGLPEFFPALRSRIEKNATFRKHEIHVEHYIVSTGLRQMILGSGIAEHVTEVWGCEFVEGPVVQQEMTILAAPVVPNRRGRYRGGATDAPTVLTQIGYVIDDTTKTRAIFEINKGSNVTVGIDANAAMRYEDRRVPFQNMIYIADGPSDVPVFSIINQYRGKTFAVYDPGSRDHFAQVRGLQDQDRVQSFGEANYQEGSQTYMWLVDSAEKIAQRIADDRRRALEDRVVPPPHHITNGGPPVAGVQ